MYEVEESAKVNRTEIKKKLRGLGIKRKEKKKEVNIYYPLPKTGYFRIRLLKNKTLCTIKTGSLGEARKEHEFQAENPAPLFLLMKKLKIKPRTVFLRTKEIYKYRQFEIILKKEEGMPASIEVEKTVKTKKQEKEARRDIKQFMKSLGVQEFYTLKSYYKDLDKYRKKPQSVNLRQFKQFLIQ